MRWLIIRDSCACPLSTVSPRDGETLNAKTILGPSHRVVRSTILRDAPGTLAPDDCLLSWLLQKLHPLRDVPWPWMWLRDSAQGRPRSSVFHNLFSGNGVWSVNNRAVHSDRSAFDRRVSLDGTQDDDRSTTRI